MGIIQDIRAKHPEYNDMSDADLADKLHAKFYPDMPREAFDAKVGVAAKPSPPQLTVGETAIDVVKSSGVGVAQGALGLATLPGNVEYLGRAGIDKAATLLGMKDPELSKTTVLPTYQDAKSKVEQYTGEFYKPQSTAGEYARTIGEFAPMAALGGGGALVRAANVVGPAFVSETAGQLTKGTEYEPYARAAGALAGGYLPNAAMRTVTPVATDTTRAAQVATLQKEGVSALTAGQKTGSRALRWAESAASDAPFNGGRGAAMNQAAAEQFTSAALRRAGVNANRATPDVMDQAFKDIGQRFDDMARFKRMTAAADPKFLAELNNSVQHYGWLVPEGMRSPLVGKIHEYLSNTVAMSGQEYKALRSRVETIRRETRDPELNSVLTKIRDTMDKAAERALPPPERGKWQTLRSQYRNLLAVEDAAGAAGENAAMGLISPSALRNAVKKQGKRSYVRGHGDLNQLARAGEAIMKPLPQSGTAPRMAAQSMFDAVGAATGMGMGGPPGAVIGAITPRLSQGAMARALMSEPMQRYLSNQAMAPAIESYNALALSPAYRAPNALMLMQQGQPLTGGIGPRYDEYGRLRQ